MMKYMLDLFSGLGGTSEAFLIDQKWEVTRIDNNPLLEDVENIEIVDVMSDNFDIKRPNWDYIHASPPCLEFSNAFNAPKSKAGREGIPYTPDTSLVKRAVEIIQWHKPKFWTIENVVGSIPDLEPILGAPRFIVGPFVFWGNIPYPIIPANFKHASKMNISNKNDPLRATKRAYIPLEISTALLSAISDQTYLEDWL
jgi:hypothetical protein